MRSFHSSAGSYARRGKVLPAQHKQESVKSQAFEAVGVLLKGLSGSGGKETRMMYNPHGHTHSRTRGAPPATPCSPRISLHVPTCFCDDIRSTRPGQNSHPYQQHSNRAHAAIGCDLEKATIDRKTPAEIIVNNGSGVWNGNLVLQMSKLHRLV